MKRREISFSVCFIFRDCISTKLSRLLFGNLSAFLNSPCVISDPSGMCADENVWQVWTSTDASGLCLFAELSRTVRV